MTALTSATHLDALVTKTSFKNQYIKRRKQQLQTQPSLSVEAPSQIISVKEENPLPVTSTNTHPTSSRISDANDHEPPKPSGIEQPSGAGASVWNASRDSQPHDLQQLCLGVSDPPWASIPYDIDQFVQLHALPGDEHPSSLDQYLLPGGGGMAGNDPQCDG
ncbi:leucine twenty homeobox [Rhinolophus ferrumequinum]|uniref:Leucine twenty homeobox n=3 Tax=Rhinolophus ferrumequinum TaxID=59479 RepID=A0A7J7WR03_RHIFE|nr:leucine twenty homeobox [Rhinolophus ferrumequinum]